MPKKNQLPDKTGAPYLNPGERTRAYNERSRQTSNRYSSLPKDYRPRVQGQAPRYPQYQNPALMNQPRRPMPPTGTQPTSQPRRPEPQVRMQVQCCVPTRRRRRFNWRPLILAFVLVLVLALAVTGGVIAHRRLSEARALANAVQNGAETSDGGTTAVTTPEVTEPPETEPPGPAPVIPVSGHATVSPGLEVLSTNAICMDLESGEVLVERLPDERIYPASMTKVMTLIVAYEELASFEETFTFTDTLINPLVEANASRAGFSAGETVPVIDLFYAAALPSGADATAALSILVAGSEEAFAERMTQKAIEMGLTQTRFANASGLHDDNHYSTVREIAAIFSYAMQIEPLREILSTYQYTCSPTPQHPEGVPLKSTLFAYLSGDELPGMRILAGKTGYTLEAKRCLVSLARSDEGREYIAVTVGGETKWTPITDALEMYEICMEKTPA
ncbi:MAG: D-alanyl-D-alanine carboxypeptidase [Clostridia bacterium]|nr:D-alanyl-D-alanine carboxypeptidase [Clostridia bacterium]